MSYIILHVMIHMSCNELHELYVFYVAIYMSSNDLHNLHAFSCSGVHVMNYMYKQQ